MAVEEMDVKLVDGEAQLVGIDENGNEVPINLDVDSVSPGEINTVEFVDDSMSVSEINTVIENVHNAGGGTVYAKAGDYTINLETDADGNGSPAIQVLSDVAFVGSGLGTVFRVPDGDGAPSANIIGTPRDSHDTTDAILANFKCVWEDHSSGDLDGGSDNIHIDQNSDRILVYNVWSEGAWGDGFDIDDSSNILVDSCYAVDVGWGGFYTSQNCENVWYTNCTVNEANAGNRQGSSATEKGALEARDSGHNNGFLNCHVDTSNGPGVSIINGASHTMVVGCQIENAADAMLIESNNCIISNNKVRSPVLGDSGIIVNVPNGWVQIVGNWIFSDGTGEVGIDVQDAESSMVNNNLIRVLGGSGITLGPNTSNCMAVGNLVDGDNITDNGTENTITANHTN